MSRGPTLPNDSILIGRRMRGLPIFLLALAALVGVGAISPYPLAVVLDALPGPILILAASTALGAALFRLLLRRRPWSADLWILSAALGVGVMALLVLALGLMGVMNAAFWWTLLLATLCLGSLVHVLPRSRSKAPGGNNAAQRAVIQEPSNSREPSDWLWLLAAPFAALALLAATMPPGVIWPAEGNGYDVLEYHLAVPKENYLNGRIGYLPHNIYANMPFNAEMLYLLCMFLIGDPIEAAMPAQMLNTLLAALAAACCWAAARPFGRGAANVAGVVVATCPMLCYLCGVAYVENGLLAMTAAALACAIRARNEPDCALCWSLLAGCFAGLACGFKYTAVPMVALPLALSSLRTAAPPGGQITLRAAAAFCAGAALMFSPWLTKNAVFTGNPVFPLARTVFPERSGIWSDELAARWYEGHLPDPRERSLGGRLRALGREVLRPVGITDDSRGRAPQFGLSAWALPVVLLLGFVVRRRSSPISGASRRATGNGSPGNAGPAHEPRNVPRAKRPNVILNHEMGARQANGTGERAQTRASVEQGNAGRGIRCCVLVIVAVLATWLAATHLVGRFAVPVLAPLAVLGGRAWSRHGSRAGHAALASILVGATVLNMWDAVDVFDDSVIFKAPQLAGRTDLLESGEWPEYSYVDAVNAILAAGKRVLLVAEARTFYLRGRPAAWDYCVVFNRNPVAEIALQHSPAEVMTWLRQRGVTHVLVHWVEMRRLRSSRYGFWEGVDEAMFERLMDQGLYVVHEFRYSATDPRPYATLYVLP